MTRLKIELSVVATVLLLAGSASAKDIYKWVDEKGTVHFQDTPPQNVGKPVQLKILPKYEEAQQIPQASEPEVINNQSDTNDDLSTVAQPAKQEIPRVELYVTSRDPYCKEARDFFQSRGLPFTEYDIEKDKDAALRKQQLDKESGVPFAVINGQGIHGFSKSAYERALQANP